MQNKGWTITRTIYIVKMQEALSTFCGQRLLSFCKSATTNRRIVFTN